MWLVQFTPSTIFCLLICTGCGLTLQEEWEQDQPVDEADDNSDFFDFPLSKLLEHIQLQREQDAEEIPDSIKTAKGQVSVMIEPEAEMLPAHYTGVKSPGVDHMELTAKSDENVYTTTVEDKKISKSKKVRTAEKKVGQIPKGVVQHSEQRRELKTVRNYVYRDAFGEDDSSELGDEGIVKDDDAQ